MDTFTHALVGALAGRSYRAAGSGLSAHQRTLAGGLSAVFPDIDYLTFWFDPLSFLSEWHRGPTHSLVLLPLWAALLGLLWSRVFDRPEARRQLILLAALALVCHVLTDVITVYGTAVLFPLSKWRPGLGITFVIDAWVTVLLILVLGASLLREGPQLPRAGLLFLLCLLTWHSLLQGSARKVGRDFATGQGIDPDSVVAIAQPLSPLHWKIVVPAAQGYHMAHIRLTERAGFPPVLAEALGLGALQQAYRARDEADWQRYELFKGPMDDEDLVHTVWAHPLLRRFREFAALPALYRIDRDGTRLCVWFTDLRFTLPSMLPSFRFGLCRADRYAPWQLYRIRLFTNADIEPV